MVDPLVSADQLCWPCPTAASCPAPAKKALMLYKHCSAITKTPCIINTSLVINLNHSTVWAVRKKISSIPTRVTPKRDGEGHHCFGASEGSYSFQLKEEGNVFGVFFLHSRMREAEIVREQEMCSQSHVISKHRELEKHKHFSRETAKRLWERVQRGNFMDVR